MPRATRFQASVGPKRVGSTYSPSFAQNVRSARESMNSIIKNYQRLVDYLEEVTPEVLYEAMEPTFELSQEYCPEDTGALKRSGYLEITEFRGKPTVEIGYGRGGQPPYATTVHENLEYRHKAPTRAKWLQVALTEDEQEIQDRIVSSYRRVFR